MFKQLILVSLSSSVLMSYNLEFSKEFSKDIVENKVYANININANDKTQDKTLDAISNVIEYINETRNITTTNQIQSLHPIYKYSNSNKMRYLDHYQARLNFMISSQDSIELTTYLEDLLEFQTNKVTISYSNLGYKIDKDTKIKAQEELRLEAIKWSSFYSKNLSYQINKTCKQIDINFSSNNSYPMTLMSKGISQASNTKSIVIPKKRLQTLSINALFKYSCN